MSLAASFSAHIQHVQELYERALTELNAEASTHQIDAVLVHSGSTAIYFGDDRHVPFEAFGHFRYWLPLNRPDQMVLMEPGKKPVYFQVVPPDFWYEQDIETASWWADCFDIVKLTHQDKVLDHLPQTRRIAFMGENTTFASALGLPSNLQNERHLTNYLDYYRGMKTEYEITQLRAANQQAVASHEAAFKAFSEGGSEWDIHLAYLSTHQMIEHDSPYTNIVALDKKAAVLHYEGKRKDSGDNSKVLLIDAGCRVNGYASDITRTYAKDSAHPVFKKLVEGMDQLQLRLVDLARPGVPYIDLQRAAHDGVLELLLENDIVHGERSALEEAKISAIFFPHGIGHLLGLQVHDVGGFFSDDHGKLAPPPEDHRFLRLNREMSAGMVFTIEPGLYFIPLLLDPKRTGEHSHFFNWPLIDALIDHGGIRMEDNVLVTEAEPVNLTR